MGAKRTSMPCIRAIRRNGKIKAGRRKVKEKEMRRVKVRVRAREQREEKPDPLRKVGALSVEEPTGRQSAHAIP